jgi:AcrR family transcriptional regulator
MPRKRLNREEKRAVTRASLLGAARKVFGRRGYYGASLDEIADEAGFSKGALYYNFGGKEGLFVALLEERLEERMRIIRDAFEEGTATEAMLETGRRYIDTLDQRREFLVLYFEFWAHAVREPKFRRHLVAKLREARRELAAVIEDWGDELAIASPNEAERFAIAANALAVGLSVEKMVDPDGVPDDLFGAMLVRLFQGSPASEREQPTGDSPAVPGVPH